MIGTLAAWFITIIAVEAVTEIITTSTLVERPRAWILAKQNFFSELLACGWCTSVWVAASVGWALPGSPTSILIIDVLIRTFALQRLSNYLHEIRVSWLQGLQLSVILHKTEKNNEQ